MKGKTLSECFEEILCRLQLIANEMPAIAGRTEGVCHDDTRPTIDTASAGRLLVRSCS
ncbi:MAG: hypothetical protein ACOY3I_03745 [Verrucomicrobiota bacterium]